MNKIIIEELEKLSSHEKYEGNFFKHKAYENAIKSLSTYSPEITNVKDILHLKGIGKGIADKINQILENKFKPPPPHDFLEDLSKIYGVGSKSAQNLIKQGITNFEILKTKQFEVLNDKQRIGLKYYHDLNQRIPHQEMKLHEKLLKSIWINHPFQIVGSYRRQENTTGDIDILVPSDDEEILSKLIFFLKKNKYFKEELALGNKKFMGIVALPHLPARRIDVLWTTPEEYPYALLYFTGSDKYNRNLREYCLKRGLKLNEKSLIHSKTKTHIPNLNSEEEILSFLKLPYLEPKDRKDVLKPSLVN